MTTSPTPSRVRHAYAVGCTLLIATALLALGSTYIWFTRPIVSDDEIRAASALVADVHNEIALERCPRPVLRGVALPGDGAEDLRELVSARSPFRACLDLVDVEMESVSAALRPGTPTDAVDPPWEAAEVADYPPAWEAEPWGRIVMGRLAHAEPLAIEGRVAAACVGLDTAVQEILQHESGCTSFPLSLPDEEVLHGTQHLFRVAWAMSLAARVRIRSGRLQEAIELLFDVARIGQDLTRGHATLIQAMVGLSLQVIATAQTHALLTSDLPWTAPVLDELTRQWEVLLNAMPEPMGWLRNEDIWARQNALRELSGSDDASWEVRDDAAIAIARAAYADARWPECADATREVCLARYRDLMRDADRASEVARTWLTETMPALERDTVTLHHYPAWLHNAEVYLARAVHDEARLRALSALFLHRRMALSGTCPSAQAFQMAVDANDLAAGLGGRFEVLPSNQAYHPLEICAPSWMTPPGATGPVRLPLLQLYCPTLRGVDLPSAPSTQP